MAPRSFSKAPILQNYPFASPSPHSCYIGVQSSVSPTSPADSWPGPFHLSFLSYGESLVSDKSTTHQIDDEQIVWQSCSYGFILGYLVGFHLLISLSLSLRNYFKIKTETKDYLRPSLSGSCSRNCWLGELPFILYPLGSISNLWKSESPSTPSLTWVIQMSLLRLGTGLSW